MALKVCELFERVTSPNDLTERKVNLMCLLDSKISVSVSSFQVCSRFTVSEGGLVCTSLVSCDLLLQLFEES